MARWAHRDAAAIAENSFTTAVHADARLAESPDVTAPIPPATTFARGDRDIHRRYGHETVQRLKAVIAPLEGSETVPIHRA